MLIKICGLTDIKETEYLNRNEVDFAGFILFYEKSKRNISIEKAKEIFSGLSKNIKKVGVCVKPTLEQIEEICKAGFDYIQIHGDVEIELLKKASLPVLKAFNVSDLDKYEEYLKIDNIKGFVLDAAEPGSGKTFDWDMVKNLNRGNKLFMLSGGLNEENVKRAIFEVKPDGVDVSSGVEFSKELVGKDPLKVDNFVKAVRL